MTGHETTVQIWQVLLAAAHNGQTINCDALGELIGGPSDELKPALDHLARFCATNGWPPLTLLVQSKATGHPGEGLASAQVAEGDRHQVFQHPWFRMPALTIVALEEAERPAKRPCPNCGREGNAAATLCGYCWVKLTPPAEGRSVFAAGSAS
jgi:hypothetical protein